MPSAGPCWKEVTADGLLLVPARTLRAGVVALPDADWTPEMFSRLAGGLPESVQFVRRLAEAGCLVASPTAHQPQRRVLGPARTSAYTNQPHREVHLPASLRGGAAHHRLRSPENPRGRRSAGAACLQRQLARDRPTSGRCRSASPVSAREGLLALYAAAIDPRIQSSWVSGYFQTREGDLAGADRPQRLGTAHRVRRRGSWPA
jgi:hypothetical protein